MHSMIPMIVVWKSVDVFIKLCQNDLSTGNQHLHLLTQAGRGGVGGMKTRSTWSHAPTIVMQTIHRISFFQVKTINFYLMAYKLMRKRISQDMLVKTLASINIR